jgi:hypothetical protein
MSRYENLYKEGCVRTVTGKYVDVFDMSADDFDIVDIAHALSHIPRFGGHTNAFVSVAEHCINTYHFSSRADHMGALLHDLSEAYILDMPSPIKKRLPEYKALEEIIMEVGSKKFGFEYPLSPGVKLADKLALEFEWDQYVLHQGVESMTPFKAKYKFLEIFNILSKEL